MTRERYTKYPRPILWLVPGGELGGAESAVREAAPRMIEPFYISKFPVTNEQFEAFDPGYERSETSPEDDDPAVAVSFEEAEEYCGWYAEVSRKPMRLPTEGEWEYACRGGSSTRFFWGDDAGEASLYLWDAEESGGRLQPAKAKKANDFGLFGMLGGIWEWVAPPHLEPGSAETEQLSLAVLRGGSFRTPRAEISCSLRRLDGVRQKLDDVGFRIVKSLR